MRIRTQHGALLIDRSRPLSTPTISYGPWLYSRVGVGEIGLGNLEPDQQQIAGIAATAVTTTVGIMAALHTTIMGVAMAGPVGAAIAGLAAIGVAIANAFAGCGQTCVAASNIANQVEAILAQNLAHYLSSPVHYRSLQLAALNNFDIAWAALYKACSNQQLLQAGVNCIQDRQQGACKWKSASGGQWVQANGQWTYQGFGPGVDDGSGVCFNWWKAYRDPIANDPTVVADPVGGVTSDALIGQQIAAGGNAVTYPTTPGPLSNLPMPLILGGIGLLAFVLLKGRS